MTHTKLPQRTFASEPGDRIARLRVRREAGGLSPRAGPPMNFTCAVRISCVTAFSSMLATHPLHGRCCSCRLTNERQLNAVSQFKAPTGHQHVVSADDPSSSD